MVGMASSGARLLGVFSGRVGVFGDGFLAELELDFSLLLKYVARGPLTLVLPRPTHLGHHP